MFRAQQKSINTLKRILVQLLEDKKKSNDKASSKKFKGKRKEGKSSSSVHIEEKGQSAPESSKPSSEKGGNSENGSTHSKRMNKLEQSLEALTNRKGLQKIGVVRPYPASGILFRTLLSSKLQPYRLLTAKGHQNNTSTNSSLR